MIFNRTLILAFTAAAIVSGPALARDPSPRPAPGAAAAAAMQPAQTNPYAVQNPYAPAQAAPAPSRDPAADAYATGFAIGLGSALIKKQMDDEAKARR